MTEFLSGLVTHRQSLLKRRTQHNRFLPRNSPPLRLHLLPTRKDGSSRSCSVIWSIPPNCPPNSTRKTGVTWYGHISAFVPKLSHALMDISPNCLGMVSSSILAIQ